MGEPIYESKRNILGAKMSGGSDPHGAFLGLLYNAVCPDYQRRKYWVGPWKTNTFELGAKVTVTCCSSCLSYKYRFSWDVGYYGDGGRVALNLEGNKKCCCRLWFPCCAVTFPLLLPNRSLPTQPLAATGLLPTVPASSSLHISAQ